MPEHSIVREGEDQFRDGLLWIGGSYRVIECRPTEIFCAIPDPAELADLSPARGTFRCFVHEAEWRGISRKVPSVPKWAVPGKTRIFLAHRGDSTEAQSHRGTIFGYFVLHRVDVLSEADTTLAPPDVQQKLPWGGKKDEGELTVTVYDAVNGRPLRGAKVQAQAIGAAPSIATMGSHSYGLELPNLEHRLMVSMPSYKPTELAGIQVPSGKRRKVEIYLQPDVREVEVGKEGAERIKECPDGRTTIVTHRFKDGKWHPTRQKCPTPEEGPECEKGAIEWSVCPDGTLIPVRICHEGKWKNTGVRCKKERPDDGEPPGPEPAPIDVEPFALHRSCSLRLRPGAVYLVDALCARISDDFAAALRKENLPTQYKQASDDAHRWSLVLAGRKVFAEIAGKVSALWKTKRKREIARQLANCAKYRGELVLFDEVVTFVRTPRAAFRGLERIDGEDLLDQIAKRVPEPTIRVYAPRADKEGMLTKGEIVARLAEKGKTTLATAENFLDTLAKVARRKLGSGGPGAFRLPRIGTLGTEATPTPTSVSPAQPADLVTELVAHLPTPATKEPSLSKEAVHRLLDHLAELIANELRTTGGAFRLPMIGTLRCQGERLSFTPSKSLEVAAVTFVSEMRNDPPPHPSSAGTT